VHDHADLIELTRQKPVVYVEPPLADPLQDPATAYAVARVLGYLPGVHTAMLEPREPPVPTNMRQLIGRDRPVHSPVRERASGGESSGLAARLEFGGSPPPRHSLALSREQLPTYSHDPNYNPEQDQEKEQVTEEYDVKVVRTPRLSTTLQAVEPQSPLRLSDHGMRTLSAASMLRRQQDNQALAATLAAVLRWRAGNQEARRHEAEDALIASQEELEEIPAHMARIAEQSAAGAREAAGHERTRLQAQAGAVEYKLQQRIAELEALLVASPPPAAKAPVDSPQVDQPYGERERAVSTLRRSPAKASQASTTEAALGTDAPWEEDRASLHLQVEAAQTQAHAAQRVAQELAVELIHARDQTAALQAELEREREREQQPPAEEAIPEVPEAAGGGESWARLCGRDEVEKLRRATLAAETAAVESAWKLQEAHVKATAQAREVENTMDEGSVSTEQGERLKEAIGECERLRGALAASEQDYIATQDEVAKLRAALQASEQAVKEGTAWAGELIERADQAESKAEDHANACPNPPCITVAVSSPASQEARRAKELEAARAEMAALRASLQEEVALKAGLETTIEEERAVCMHLMEKMEATLVQHEEHTAAVAVQHQQEIRTLHQCMLASAAEAAPGSLPSPTKQPLKATTIKATTSPAKPPREPARSPAVVVARPEVRAEGLLGRPGEAPGWDALRSTMVSLREERETFAAPEVPAAESSSGAPLAVARAASPHGNQSLRQRLAGVTSLMNEACEAKLSARQERKEAVAGARTQQGGGAFRIHNPKEASQEAKGMQESSACGGQGTSLREAIEKRQHAYEEEKRKERMLYRDPSPETLRNRSNTNTPVQLKQRIAGLRTPMQERTPVQDAENHNAAVVTASGVGAGLAGVIPRSVW